MPVKAVVTGKLRLRSAAMGELNFSHWGCVWEHRKGRKYVESLGVVLSSQRNVIFRCKVFSYGLDPSFLRYELEGSPFETWC